MPKHVLMRGTGNWLCLRCRKAGEKWWIETQPCLEALPIGNRTPTVCDDVEWDRRLPIERLKA